MTARPVMAGVARAALAVAAVTVVARVAGFARVLVFARTVGPTCLGDAYYTANTIPNIVFDIVAGGALASLVVPVLARPMQQGDDATADRITAALLTWTVALLVPVMLLGFAVAGPVVHLLVGAGHRTCPAGAEAAAGSRMLLVFAPQVVLYGVAVVCTGVLQAGRRFVGPAAAPLVSSAVVMSTYLVYGATSMQRDGDLSTSRHGAQWLLAAGTTAGVAALAVPLLFLVWRRRGRLRPTWRFPPGVAGTVRRTAVSGAVVLGSQQLATGVLLRLANDHGSAGAVVLYTLAWTVFLLPWSVLAVPLGTAAFPDLTARFQAGDVGGYDALAARTVRASVAISAAAAAVLAAAAFPAARVVVLGAPGDAVPAELARALAAFAPGLVGYAAVAVLSRALYARGDARTPAVAVAAGWGAAVVADVIAAAAAPASWTVAALAGGVSLGMTVSGVWLVVALRHVSTASTSGVPRTAAVAGVAAVAAGCVGSLLAGHAPTTGVAGSLAVATGVALVVVLAYVAGLAAGDRDAVRLLLRRPAGA